MTLSPTFVGSLVANAPAMTQRSPLVRVCLEGCSAPAIAENES
jgi:hypothetical protein